MSYHFIGLGGVGMSALARILLQRGEKVRGSDVKTSPLLEELQSEGASVFIGHDADQVLPESIVVFSSDIKEDNSEYCKAQEQKLPLLHRASLLHELMNGKKGCLVAGTHGKTTTTALLASVLMQANLDPSFVVGGQLLSLKTNGRAGSGDLFVAEADESDGSFLKTSAFAAIVTNISDDHLDYWGSSRMLDLGFQQFIAQTEHPFWCIDDPRLAAICEKMHRGVSYGFSSAAHFRISRFRQTANGIIFDLNEHRDIELALFGRHNALNGAAVFGLALHLGVAPDVIRSAFQTFSGTARRLEFKGEKRRVAVYDDYGHHPREIAATIKALRDLICERRLIVVFQPHRYSRSRNLIDAFAPALQEADLVFMTDIYSAGELPIEGISSALLYTRMREQMGGKLHFLPRTHLEMGVANVLRPHDVVLTIGAGDVTKAGEPILDLYVQRAPKLHVALLFGGTSAEHPVSLMSARNIFKGIDPSLYEVTLFGITTDGRWLMGSDVFEKLEHPVAGGEATLIPLEALQKCDVAIPVFHGPEGEDGMIAGLLETLQIPYVGCDYRSGSICMQKTWTKCIARQHNVPVAPFLEIDQISYRKNPEAFCHKLEELIPYPVYVKPVHLGSSIGVSRAETREQLLISIEQAFHYDDTIIVEQEIANGRQIEFSIMGNDYIRIAPPAEIVNQGAFVPYERKYGTTAWEICTPAPISDSALQIGRELAEKMYIAASCKGLSRIDFFLDARGCYWFNEINPFPGYTDTSAFPKSWQAAGLSCGQIVDEWIVLALHKHRLRKLVQRCR